MSMTKLFYIILLSLCCNAFFTGCSTEEKISVEVLRYRERDTISLNLQYGHVVQNEVGVKSPVVINETAVNNVNIYVLNELGDVLTHQYVLGNGAVSGLVIHRNMRHSIYAVANAGECLPRRTMAELEAITSSIESIAQVADPSGGVLMSGKTDLQLLTDGQTIRIDFVRCICKFVLRCDDTQLNPGVQITVKKVQLKGAPAEISLFQESKATGGRVIEGEVRTGADLNLLSGSGVPFYLFENLQGVVAPTAMDNKQKELQMSADAKGNSSYIEMEYEYLSPSKKGTIIYRFYLGKSHTDCDIKRNAQYTCTVFFKGDGSADENSWSVDNSGLADLVTSIAVNPAILTLLIGETGQLTATVLPANATVETLVWSSSNPLVATVDTNGYVTAVGAGSAKIKVATNGVWAECEVTVVQPEIAFPSAGRVMYDGEVVTVPYAKLVPSTVAPVVSVSNANVEVLEVSTTGIRIKANRVGTAVITATVGTTVATYTVDVQPLRIQFTETAPVTVYTNFNKTIDYTVYPEHARHLPVKFSYGDAAHAAYFIFPDVSVSNRVQGKAVNGSEMNIIASFEDFPAKSFTTSCIVKPCLEMDNEFKTKNVDLLANAYITKFNNIKHPDIVTQWQVGYTAAPQATVVWKANKEELKIRDGLVYTEERTPANGSGYYVTVSVTGDNGVVTSFTSKEIKIFEEIAVYLYGKGTFLREESVGGEYLPVFDVEWRHFVSHVDPTAPIIKEVIEHGELRFGDRPFGYTFHSQVHGARGDTDYEQTTNVFITYKRKKIGKYELDPIIKYYMSY